MTTAAPATHSMGGGSTTAGVRRFIRRNGWVLALFVLLGAQLVFTKMIQPNYGTAAFGILVLATLPYAFATAGQSIAIIAGGIDLSMAAMMTLLSVSAAALMHNQGEEFGILAVALILLMGVGVGAINGLSVVFTRVPDIVVTLSFFFIWEGAALMVMDAPGGGAATWLKELIIGSDKLAAHRSGVAVDRTKIASYALAGLFAAMGGLILTMSTGIGTPMQGPYLMASVAAAVLGGVSLAGGKGGLVGPIVAVFILRLARQDLTLMSVDPNVAQVVEGLIMVVVVLVGAAVALRGRRS